MIEIITDEYAWCESAIENHFLGRSPAETISRLARYYHSLGYKKGNISKLLEEHIMRCDPSISIVKFQGVIDSAVKWSDKRPLFRLSHISITKSEMNQIKRINGVLAQKTMFTLLCLAKYGNAIRSNNQNWVNFEKRDIFSLACITLSAKRQSLILNDLWRLGYIGMSHIVDNTHVFVKVIDDDSDVAMKISDFRNLGNQYMSHIGNGYFACANCGLVVKRMSPSHKHCKACAADIKIIKTIENRRTSSFL